MCYSFSLFLIFFPCFLYPFKSSVSLKLIKIILGYMFLSTCQKLCFLYPYYWIFLIFYLYLILSVSISTCLPICLPIIYLLEHNCNSLQYPKCVNLFFDKFILFNIGLNIRKASSFSGSLYRDGHLLFWMSLFTSLQITNGNYLTEVY